MTQDAEQRNLGACCREAAGLAHPWPPTNTHPWVASSSAYLPIDQSSFPILLSFPPFPSLNLIPLHPLPQVLNMKPPEILGLLEEAAGTKMYEDKKRKAVATLEKKQLKVDEINTVGGRVCQTGC